MRFGSRSRQFVGGLLLLTALILVPVQASAQATTSFGIQGGLNIANFAQTSGNPDSNLGDFKSRNLGVFGFVVARDFNPNVGLQVDVLYSQKGTTFDISSSFIEEAAKYETRVDYIEVPILMRANVPSSSGVTFRVFGGPAFGFKVSDESFLTEVGIKDDDGTEFKSTDVSLVVGGALQFGQTFVDLRYSWGLVNILDAEEPEWKTRTFGIMLGFLFR